LLNYLIYTIAESVEKLGLAEGALRVLEQPFLDALFVEEVEAIAREDHHIHLPFEVFTADSAPPLLPS